MYTELIMGLSDVIRPLSIRDIMLPRVTMPITDLERKENRNGMAYLLRLTPVLKGVDLFNIALTKRTSASWSLPWLTQDILKKIVLRRMTKQSIHCISWYGEQKKNQPTHRNLCKAFNCLVLRHKDCTPTL